MESKELPTLETKQINGVNVTNLEIAKIAMVCDYLVLDRFQDLSSFLRFENVLGLYFQMKNLISYLKSFKKSVVTKKIYYIRSSNFSLFNLEISPFKK